MKKNLITFLTLSFLVVILLLPAILWLHANMMAHHDMSASDCIEHCMDLKTYTDTPKVISTSLSLEVIIIKIIFSQVFEYVVPLFLLYILLSHAPPNLYRGIKNYDFSSLLGIVKLTT